MYSRSYVPALGDHRLSPFYDATVALMTCERTWRRAFVKQIAPEPRDVILDVGCGTGTLAILLKRECPGASVYGTDPDPDILSRAELKARDADVLVHFSQGYAQETAAAASGIRPNKIVSSLVLHQVPLAGKRDAILSAFAGLRAGGELHIADYGEQRSPLMRLAFRQVQSIDGFKTTQPNADGALPGMIEEAGFVDIEETVIIPTPTGSISLYRARRP
ncbi:MAG: methyltransferase domain-containing protein [Alphaproteobacteria bacterium]|nr:methyltransferase domain-containing protein [Alphaproteobacteria bacterium]